METNSKINPDYMLRKAMHRTETPSPELLTKIRYNTINERPAVRSYYRSRRILAIAAVVTTLAALTTVALATSFFGLRNTALPAPEVGDNVHGRIVTEEIMEDPEANWITAQPFSLQGFEGSPEHSALAEWMAFLYQYDTDGALREAVGNTWGDVPEAYQSYGAYTMEMVEKIREITEKYGLTLKGGLVDTKTQEELQMVIADGPLFTDDSILFNGSIYESGSFWLEGQYGEYMFSLRSSQKGVFCDVYNVNRDNVYDEWVYTNAHGSQLLMTQSISKSSIIMETETAFIMMNIGAGTEGNPYDTYTNTTPFSRSDFEHFADLIDFGKLRTGTPDPARIEAVQTRRDELNATIASLVGPWNHVRSTSVDGTEISLPMEVGLKIYEDRHVFAWYGIENPVEYNETNVFAAMDALFMSKMLSTSDSWTIVFVAVPGNEDEFKLELSGATSGINVPTDNFDSWMSYDAASGMLKFTDWIGYIHFFTR